MSLSIAADPLPLAADAHGVVRVAGTRVTLDQIVFEYDRGSSPEQTQADFDSLDLADVFATITYVLKHRSEVDAYLAERKAQREAIREDNARRFGTGETLREKARRFRAGT